jgi:ribonucleoside-diphosphate reductase alpha subunit
MSRKECTHATPTLFHAGTERNQLASCFLLQIEDNLDDMYSIVHKCALISKYGGGIGIALHKLRCNGSMINTSRGRSSGILPYLRVLDAVSTHVDQGGKRPGAIAVYLEPWHPDVLQFINARHPMTLPEESAPHLNYALWVNDLFMERVRDDGMWSLFCPGEHPELVEYVGDCFKSKFLELESEGAYKTQMKARDLWQTILKTQIEVGMPYLLFKDACNLKSNQQNLGTLYSSNLCAEIVEHTSNFETAVCNLASICLSSCVTEERTFDFVKLQRVTRMLVRNLNKLIDNMMYTTSDCRFSNESHRPIGIGVQGYADVFAMMRVSWESDAAKELTEQISAHMYYAAISESCELAKVNGATYSSFKGSPLSHGRFQFDLWNTPGLQGLEWETLRNDVQRYGVRNSLCIALMPTASTSNIFGNNESIEPFTFNLYTRRTLAGEFPIMNKYLVRDLIDLGLWNRTMYERLVSKGGSVKDIMEIPEELRNLYKTAREIKKVPLLELAAIRGRYTCQSQSLNVYIDGNDSDVRLLHNYHMKAWQLGLKTSSYYTHSLPKSNAANVISGSVCESCSA